jgi:hypothetical protein
MVFEAVGEEEDAVEDSMDEHVDTLKAEDGIEVKEVDRDDVKKMEDPHPGLEEGYSTVVEVTAEFDGFDTAIQTVLNYGPTYVQIQGPDQYNIGLGEAQDAMQKVASTMHQYAQMGAGGVLVSNTEES